MYINLIRTQRPHWGKYSGINQFVKYIDRSKYNINIQTASDSDDDFPIQQRAVRALLRHLVQKSGMQWYKLSDLLAEIKACRQCWKRKVDIIHYLDGEHSAQYLPKLFRWPRKVRPKMISMYHQPPHIVDSLISKNVICGLDRIIVLSPEQVSYFKEFVSPDRIRLILHGIDTEFFKPAKIAKKDRKFKCITVGHWLRDWNALRAIAEKLLKHKDIEFHIVTSKRTGPRQIGLEDLPNVSMYKDHVDDDDFLKLYQQSDLLLMPLVQSTANNALLEAIACGLPVVSTLLPSVKAYLPGREAILVKNNDPGQLAEAIVHLYQDSSARGTMTREALKRAKELDWRNIAPQYEAIYSELTSAR
jgi:glycosyltransferase involved in cell wall biosynthesis